MKEKERLLTKWSNQERMKYKLAERKLEQGQLTFRGNDQFIKDKINGKAEGRSDLWVNPG